MVWVIPRQCQASKWKKIKLDNFTTNNYKFIVFGMFSRYFSLILMMAVSKFLLNDVLHMFLLGMNLMEPTYQMVKLGL